ncbi:iron-containing alcohol dehydrogenase [Parvularcula lutaonensis]|uniref:Iron-containing alcohol dehydrogenase n=1 Tax=Parvularcula lutaonensis TaxID=491923 RepID=A0ABV7MBU8_9PROT|nr:iron-containing alcohol dehydrogenase [Parvularcula lutaonensis]
MKTIRFEPGIASQIADPLGGLLGERVLVVTDPGLIEIGLPGPALKSLQDAGAELSVFYEVESDPSLGTLMKAVDLAKEDRVTGVLGFGGGSSMDVAKLTALLAGSGEDIDGAWGVGNAKGPRLPLALVPTTAGTGSEVTPVSIITLPGDEKRGVSSPLLIPDAAILDPDLTLGLPPHTTAATGIDAMVHAIEAYASASPNNNPMSKSMAIEALKLLGPNIERAVRSPKNREARGAMLLGAMMAGQAFANAPVAAVHALAYPIGGRFHVSHGLSNAIVLPHVLRFNAAGSEEAMRMYAELSRYAFPDLPATDGAQAQCAAFIERLAHLAEDLGLETKLRDVGIGKGDLPKLASDAMLQTRLLVNNPRNVSEADALRIYEQAF